MASSSGCSGAAVGDAAAASPSSSPSGRALVFAAADRARRAVVEGRKQRSVGRRAEQHAAALGIDADGAGRHRRLVVPADHSAAAVEDVAQVADAYLARPAPASADCPGAAARGFRRRRSRRRARASGAGTVLACAARTASAISRTDRGSGTLIGSARWLMSSSVRGAAEQPQVGAQRIDAELAAAAHRPGRASAAAPSAAATAAATGRCRYWGCCSGRRRSPAGASRRVCARRLKAPPCRSNGAERRAGRPSPAPAGRMCFMYCVVASSSKNSTACAGQSVTSLRQLLEHQRRALAPAIGDGVGDLGARRGDLRRHAVQRPIADQVADIGRDPVGAGLDELVVVELLDILLERGELLGQAPRSARAAARPARRRAGDRRPAAGDRGARRSASSCHLLQIWSSGPGSSVSSSAGRATPFSTRMRDASSRTCCEATVCGDGCVPP